MKKIILLILTLLVFNSCAYAAINLLSDDEGILTKSTYKVNAIDPTGAKISNSAFPGGRGSNELIVFTPAYGFRTGTNEFGTEAVVQKDIVRKMSGADSVIPGQGFVISGHGSAKKWILENINIGTKIFLDPAAMTITAYTTIESYRYGAKEKIREAKKIIRDCEKSNSDYDFKKADFYVQRAEAYLVKSGRRDSKSLEYAMSASAMADEAIQHSVPYKNGELKGVWIRPIEADAASINATLDKIAAMGINNIFLETYYHGKTIYPSLTLEKYKVRNQREEFVGWDPLSAWIEGAHKRNIKVHAWFEAFYAGNTSPSSDPLHILSVYPSWANYPKIYMNSPTPVSHPSEHNGYFLDPANPQVRTFLLDLVSELTTRYNIDGINFDYVRYPQIVTSNMPNYEYSNWGYTKFARDDFKKRYGLDPVDVKFGTPEWNKWSEYRQGQITEFLRCVRKQTMGKNIKISTVVFPNRQKSLETKMQDWATWSQNNYVDAFTPLILSCDDYVAQIMIQDIKRGSTSATDIYPGLFVAYMDGNAVDLLRQIYVARQIGSKGIILFDYAHLSDKYIKPLKSGAFLPK